MKKSALMLILAFSLAVSPTIAYAGPTPEPTEKTAEASRAEVLLNRLEEIKSMDKSEMTRTEKKALRKEVKAIKSELAANNNGIYLSVGAIIIIILLLILLL
ncbi:MAG: hypothetical protein EOO48_06275 [Flavobacterium sp.]|nr:MAG: hypothetical protein EOO48_06275 [Flavobacterium sp.]